MIPDPMPSYGEGLEPRRLEGGLSGCLLAGVLGGVTGGLFSRRIIEIFGHLGPARSTLGFAGGLTIAGVLALVMISRNLDRAGRGLAREDLTTVGGMLLVGSILIGLISQMEWAHGSFNAANLVLAPTLGLAFGLILGVVHLGRRRLLVAPQSPVELVANSGKIGLVAGGVAGGLIGLAQHYSVGLGFPGLAPGMFGLVLGLTFGLGCVVLHYTFRAWSWAVGRGPLRWARFLAWASDHLLLQTTGASYQWIHLKLRDYLAEQYPSDA